MVNDIIKGNQNTTKLLNFLKQQVTQYPCLSKAKERDLIEKYRNDRTKLNELLFMHNIKIVFNQAKKYMMKVNDFDTLVQDGMNGLSEAVKRFDIDKGVKFITYAVPWVRKYMLMHFYGKTVELDKRSIYLDSPAFQNSMKANLGNEATVEDYINEQLDPTLRTNQLSAADELSGNEVSDICKDLYKQLDEDQSLSSTDKAVFTDIFCNKEKIKDVADKYNMQIKNVTEIKQKILKKFKNILVNEYNIKNMSDLIA